MIRWLRRLLVLAVLAAAAMLVAGWTALNHLDLVAKWAVERAFPGAVVKMKSLRMESATRLEAREIELRSKRTGEALLKLDGGSVSFALADLWNYRLEDVRLNRPEIRVSPDLADALGIKPSQKSGGGFAWSIGRIAVTDGALTVVPSGGDAPEASLKFAFDFEDFGPGADGGTAPRTLRLTDIEVREPGKAPFFKLREAKIGFRAEGIFTRSHLDSLETSAGSLSIDPALMDKFVLHMQHELVGRSGSPSSGGAAGGGVGWTVGSLDLGGLDVALHGLAAPARSVSFRLSAALRNVGAPGTGAGDDEQVVTISNLDVRSGMEAATRILSADAASARVTIAGLAARRIRELRLVNPAIRVGPELMPQETASAATDAPASLPEWTIERLVSDYGTLDVRGLGGTMPDITTKFAFDIANAGTTPDLLAAAHKITVWDAQARAPDGDAATFLTLDLATVAFTPEGLLRARRIDAITIDGGKLTIGEALQAMLADSGSATAPPAGAAHWTVGTLGINGLRARLEDRRANVPDVDFTLNTTFKNIALSAAPDQVLDEVQTVEFADIEIPSPTDPSARVVTLRSVFVRFTISDLAKHRLREIVILRPTLYLSQDLFAYMGQATASGEDAPEDAEPGWTIDRLAVKFGSLVIGSGGRRDVGLPIGFETVVENVAFDHLESLQFEAGLSIPTQSYSFESYQLALDDVGGELHFSYPPDAGKTNVVQKLDMRRIRWRQYEAGASWIAVTFDAQGINGTFGGEAYDGYVNGGFSFFFQGDSPWVGWVSGAAIDTKELTAVVSPHNFQMTGPIDFEIQLDAFRKNIERVRGGFTLAKPGKLTIGKLDDLMANIPAAWPGLKQDSTRIALETLRDFDYTDASGDFWFVQSQGIFNLNLSGPHGARNFQIALHDGAEARGVWLTGARGGD